MAKIKSGDQVIIITGKDKGKTGKVISVHDGKVKVEGLNLVTKHKKPNKVAGIEGGRITLEAPLAISNVAIFNAATQKADRIGYQLTPEGTKIRVYKSNGEPVAAAQ